MNDFQLSFDFGPEENTVPNPGSDRMLGSAGDVVAAEPEDLLLDDEVVGGEELLPDAESMDEVCLQQQAEDAMALEEEHGGKDMLAVDNTEVTPDKKVSKIMLQQALLRFFMQQGAQSVALKVPVRTQRGKADVAACWMEDTSVTTAVAFLVYPELDGSALQQGQNDLEQLLEEKSRLEAAIREEEPDLKRCDDLFPENCSYDYSASSNAAYGKVLSTIGRLRKKFCRNSMLQQIRKGNCADFYYLAAPENTLMPEMVPDGWSLIWIGDDLSCRVVRSAGLQTCQPEMRMRLICNIAMASRNAVLFANGLRQDDSGEWIAGPLPRRRRSCWK